MSNLVHDARALAEKLRFSRDIRRQTELTVESDLQPALDEANINQLRVTSEVTPGLAKSLSEVCRKLKLPFSAINSYVYPTPDIQAECYSDLDDKCIIRFSSGLIDLLNEQEFQFVAGHEIGHFLLQHGVSGIGKHKDSLEYFILSRYQEISVDRLGLYACGSVDIAIKAMMKTLSGLSGRHLRQDTGAFISQLKEVNSVSSQMMSTHPSIPVRCRALLWFSMECDLSPNTIDSSKKTIELIDQRIENDIDKYVDRDARDIIEKAKSNLAMWLMISTTVKNGVFKESEQKQFSENFGAEVLTKMKNFLSNLNTKNAEEVVYERVLEARGCLEKLIPESFETEMKNFITKYELEEFK